MLEFIHSIDFTPVWLSLRVAGVTVSVLLLIAIPLAWWLAHTHSMAKVFVETLTALPLVLPPTVLGFYLLLLMGNQGLLGQFWIGLTGSTLAFSFEALVIASVLYSMPFVVQPLHVAFASIDQQALEAAWTLGASRMKSFFTIVIPQARNGFISAIVLGFAHTVGEFGVILMVGGNIPGETQVIAIAIYEQVETLNYSSAHIMSAGLLLFSFIVLAIVYGANRNWGSGLRA